MTVDGQPEAPGDETVLVHAEAIDGFRRWDAGAVPDFNPHTVRRGQQTHEDWLDKFGLSSYNYHQMLAMSKSYKQREAARRGTTVRN